MNRLTKWIPYLAICTAILTCSQQPLQAECLCKIDIGPAYAHIDVLESKNTVKELNMPAVRGDASLVVWNGWLFKPTITYGKESDGELVSYGAGVGRCIPIMDRIIITPTVGITYTDLSATIELDLGPMGEIKFRERFCSLAPYTGIEVILKVTPGFRICANAQYAWSHSKTKIKDLLSSHSDAEGPNYGFLLEYDLNCDWSVNLGGMYNESLSKEKNGIRGHGIKLGIARWL